jgi:glutaminyl-peptide cyclotransferase
MAPSPRGDGRAGPPVRILVVALVMQIVLGAAIIYGAVAGFPLIGGGGDGAPATTEQRPAAPPMAGRPGTSRRRTVDRFDARAAYALAAGQVRVGQRPAGSPQLRRLAEQLRRRLPGGRFEAVAGWPRLRNVVGTLPGTLPAIVIGAHYDTLVKPRGAVGANNGAAGTAIVVQLARDLQRVKRPPGAPELRFVLFDGEEPAAGLPEEQTDFYAVGVRGSRSDAARHARTTRAMLLLDYVGNRGLQLPREGSSDPALWSRLRAAAAKVGAGAVFPDATETTILDDHTPFLRAGVPAVDLIDWRYPGHTPADTLDKLSLRSMDAVGETLAELLVGLGPAR